MRSDLIYDIGLHKGEDTEFYLRKGYSVVGVEADPDLVSGAKIRFRDAIARGRLQLIEGAVAPRPQGATVVFYANRGNSVWGTIEPEWVSRNERLGYPSDRKEVTRIDIAEVYRTRGIPFYLKVDIEGADHLVIEALQAFQERPQYISLESEKVDISRLRSEMCLLRNLGYGKFKIVQQETIPGSKIRTLTIEGQSFEYVFEAGSSGPFGSDLPGPWLSYDKALEEYDVAFRRYRLFGDHSLIGRMPIEAQNCAKKFYKAITGVRGPVPGWFDTHASL